MDDIGTMLRRMFQDLMKKQLLFFFFFFFPEEDHLRGSLGRIYIIRSIFLLRNFSSSWLGVGFGV